MKQKDWNDSASFKDDPKQSLQYRKDGLSDKHFCL